MRKPNPPFLELGFYFSYEDDSISFRKLLEFLLSHHARLTGEIGVHEKSASSTTSFAGITDELIVTHKVESWSMLEQMFDLPDVRIVQVGLRDLLDVPLLNTSILTYLSISTSACSIDRHPISIWLDGSIFGGYGEFEQKNKDERYLVGMAVLQLFRKLILNTNPSYATITLSEKLECPIDIRMNLPSYAFQNFFLSQKNFSTANILAFCKQYGEPFHELIGNGIYVSTMEEFNPNRHSASASDRQKITKQISKIISQTDFAG